MSRLLTADWHLTLLLGLLLLVIFVLYPISDGGLVLAIILQSFLTLILLSGAALASRSKIGRKLGRKIGRTFVIVLAISTAVIGWVRTFFTDAPLNVFGISIWVVFLATLTVLIIFRIFAQGRINMHRIQGAVAAYLLLGVIWSGLYRLVVQFDPRAFTLPSVVDESTLMSKLVYFSFVTLTTVGYGDVTAVHTAARSLAILEALIGQLFPAVLIARLVSMEVVDRTAPPP
ncbi:MAG TPA: potassium channel family protein [Blastocatellia bacterium]|nr:potassium channel family protein [Blastocatellia bacterium]